MKVIDKFEGEYKFLSNFYPGDHRALELKYQVSKIRISSKESHEWAAKIWKCKTPKEARTIGKHKLPKKLMKHDFDEKKTIIMFELLKEKFSDNKLKKKLLATGHAKLIEGNWWGDTFWGVCKGEGKNMLGRLLMVVREELR